MDKDEALIFFFYFFYFFFFNSVVFLWDGMGWMAMVFT